MNALRDFGQAKGPFKRILNFGPYGLKYQDRMFGPGKERSVLYEELAMDRVVRGTHLDLVSGLIALGTAVVALTVAAGPGSGFLAVLPWLVMCAVASGYCWLRSGPYVEIPVIQGLPIRLYGNRPGEEQVGRLVAELGAHARDYAIRKFGPIPGAAPRAEQVGRLRWLRERNYITDDELDGWIKELDAGSKFKGSGAIGFASAKGE